MPAGVSSILGFVGNRLKLNLKVLITRRFPVKYNSLFLATMFTLSNAFGFEESKIDALNKIYVQFNQISLSERGIFVYLEDAWIATEAIHSDSSGMYVTHSVGDNYFGWACPNCGTENSSFSNMCKKCGYR